MRSPLYHESDGARARSIKLNQRQGRSAGVVERVVISATQSIRKPVGVAVIDDIVLTGIIDETGAHTDIVNETGVHANIIVETGSV